MATTSGELLGVLSMFGVGVDIDIDIDVGCGGGVGVGGDAMWQPNWVRVRT